MTTRTQTLMDVPSAFRSLFWPVAALLALLLAMLWLLGFGPGRSACAILSPSVAAAPAALPGSPPAPAPTAPAAPVPEMTSAAAPVAVIPPVAKVYFETKRFDVKDEGKAAVDPVIAYLKANSGAKALIAGFHDPRGDKTKNEELALNRARAVRTYLEEQGIVKDRVTMAKPVETTGDGSLAEARRVEVSVQR